MCACHFQGAEAYDEIDFDEEHADDDDGMQPEDMAVDDEDKDAQVRVDFHILFVTLALLIYTGILL